MIKEIQNCFQQDKVLYSKHAKNEMDSEEFGVINENEVFEAVIKGKVIFEYSDDTPYPSCLIYGTTNNNRPLHIVCAYTKEEEKSIIITVYEPDPNKWIDFERRKR